MTSLRPPVEVLSGRAGGALRGIEGDFALLEASGSAAAVRVWTCEEAAVVLGVSRDAGAEVDDSECARRGVAVLRRASGGGTVVIGPGTVQYAVVLPHRGGEALPIDVVKNLCSEAVRSALGQAGVAAAVAGEPSGDLRIGERKVGGVALRRRRDATLLHGTLLAGADLETIAAVLRHPLREPAWRVGRAHLDFLANLGPFDAKRFEGELRRRIDQRS